MKYDYQQFKSISFSVELLSFRCRSCSYALEPVRVETSPPAGVLGETHHSASQLVLIFGAGGKWGERAV